jgi:hypothetical protein
VRRVVGHDRVAVAAPAAGSFGSTMVGSFARRW